MPRLGRPRESGTIAWRVARLRAAGCRRQLAEQLARDTRYDLHALLELVDRGCPADVAARIVAPLDLEGKDQRCET